MYASGSQQFLDGRSRFIDLELFLGLSVVFAAPVFGGDRQQNKLRLVMYVNAILCLAGTG